MWTIHSAHALRLMMVHRNIGHECPGDAGQHFGDLDRLLGRLEIRQLEGRRFGFPGLPDVRSGALARASFSASSIVLSIVIRSSPQASAALVRLSR